MSGTGEGRRADSHAQTTYYAHSENKAGRFHLLKEHLFRVGELAAEFARAFDETDRARAAGILHDLGKYGDLFQQRLCGQESGVDHWSAGAWIALKVYRHAGIPVALAIEGHHLGLQQWAKSHLEKLAPSKPRPPEAPRLSERNTQALLDRLAADGLSLPAIPRSRPSDGDFGVACMLDVRMLFSALVDADFLDTERHFDPEAAGLRQAAAALEAEHLLGALKEYRRTISRQSTAAEPVRNLREELFNRCLEMASGPRGLYTLSAPTGSGKTLALLGFALEHARRHRLRRIVVVLPFLSVIDQTVQVYRKALEKACDVELNVLEDHSLAEREVRQRTQEGDDITKSRLRGLLAENWDAPIVITTSVQFLESLFANRASKCRKLHRLAESVVIFDEVQTLRPGLAIATLAALTHLSLWYGATVVLATATQPAFKHLNRHVRRLSSVDWRPEEIAPPEIIASRARKVEVEWLADGGGLKASDLGSRLATHEQALCILNTRADARAVFLELSRLAPEGLYHLSTWMCPLHRQNTIEEIRQRLHRGEPCRLVATQCVEAGVDLDFPVVYRALAPLDALAQAAGRCNRNGRLAAGRMFLFRPEPARYPSAEYRQATDLTACMLREQNGRLDLLAAQLYEEFFRRWYDVSSIEQQEPELYQAVAARDFREVARSYQVIPEADAINVLTAYAPELFAKLAEEVRRTGLSRDWIRRARPLTVGVYRRQGAGRLGDFLEPVLLRDGKPAGDWYMHLKPEDYDARLGLQPPAEMELLCL